MGSIRCRWRNPSPSTRGGRRPIYDGGTRSDAARLGNVTLQIVRDWVMRFNERGPQGLVNGKAPGHPSRMNDQQRAALAQAIERGPTPCLDGVVRWRLCDLAQWLWEEFRVSVTKQELFDGVTESLCSAWPDHRIKPLHEGITSSIRRRETSAFRPAPPRANVEHDFVFSVHSEELCKVAKVA